MIRPIPFCAFGAWLGGGFPHAGVGVYPSAIGWHTTEHAANLTP